MNYSTKTSLDQLTYEVMGAAIQIHKVLGPGLLESIYHECMKIELEDRGIVFRSEHSVKLVFKGRELETIMRCDLFIEDSLIVELKSVKELLPVHEAQVLSYMKLLNVPKGIPINLQCNNLFREGQRTFVNEFFRALPV